MLIINSILFI